MEIEIITENTKNYTGGGYPEKTFYTPASVPCISSFLKKLLALAVFFCFALAVSYASNVRWSWPDTDENIQYYRYQLNSEDANGWILADGNTTSVVLGLDKEKNIFYLQASYDGVAWSKSSKGTYSLKEETSEIVDSSTKRYELSLLLFPYTYQYVRYTGSHNPQTRASYYGVGGGLSFDYNFEEKYSLGTIFSYQWHDYRDFHYYNDFELSLSMRYKVFKSQNEFFKVYLSHSIGADFVIRDDGDKGVYPLFGIIGITESVRISTLFSLNWGGSLTYTFQNGSSVLHFTPCIGMTWHFGKEASCRGC